MTYHQELLNNYNYCCKRAAESALDYAIWSDKADQAKAELDQIDSAFERLNEAKQQHAINKMLREPAANE